MRDQLAIYIRARYPVIYVVSPEERRVESAIAAVAQSLAMGLYKWSIVTGFSAPDGSAVESALDPTLAIQAVGSSASRGIYILRDFHPFLDSGNPGNVLPIRALRELAQALKNAPKTSARTVIIIAPKLQLPLELQSDVAVLEWSLPSSADLRSALDEIVNSLPPEIRGQLPADLAPVVTAAQGLTLDEAQNCFARSLVQSRMLDPAIIAGEKKQAVSRSGLVEWIDPDPDAVPLQGYEELNKWLSVREVAFSAQAREFGLPVPKGLLLVGVAGCGKSLAAKTVADRWQKPLIRLDVGRIFGALVGQSESQLNSALALAEAVAPCILWLDEIEKAFAGLAGGGQADAGTSARVFGRFLTWLQEKKAPVFVVATANDVSALPPELLRKGRFDECFFVDLPETAEREAIWRAHANKRGPDPDKLGIAALAQKSAGFSGAEIEAVLIESMFRAFAGETPLNQGLILNVLSETVPLSKTASEKIDALRAWAKGRARSASAKALAKKTGRNLDL